MKEMSRSWQNLSMKNTEVLFGITFGTIFFFFFEVNMKEFNHFLVVSKIDCVIIQTKKVTRHLHWFTRSNYMTFENSFIFHKNEYICKQTFKNYHPFISTTIAITWVTINLILNLFFIFYSYWNQNLLDIIFFNNGFSWSFVVK